MFPFLRIVAIIQDLYQIINIIARHKVTFHLKELSQVFWGERNTDTLTLSSSSFHYYNIDPNSSV
jgi:hypothetical protein